MVLIATGSEVHLALQVQQLLQKEGTATRVVSMPSWEVFRDNLQNTRTRCCRHRSAKE